MKAQTAVKNNPEMPAGQKPTRARYTVLLFAVTLAVITYLDRFCISQTAPLISRDLGFDKAQMGWVFAAFNLAYGLFEVPTGWWGDRVGPRKILMRVVVWWSVFTMLTGAAWNYVSMLVVRFMFGAGEAGAFPNVTKMFSIWLPKADRPRAQGILWMSARWGGAAAPPLVVLVLTYVPSWRWTFVVFGLIGVVWCAVFYWWFRDNPALHKSVNAAELALLPRPEEVTMGHGPMPWGLLLKSKQVWLICAQYVCQSYSFYFLVFWLPTYLLEARGMNMKSSAWLAALPTLLGGFGCFLSGMMLPALGRNFGLTATRKATASLALIGAGLLMYSATMIESPGLAVLAMSLAFFSNDLSMPVCWTVCMDIGGKMAGTVSGAMNMIGNLGGFISQVVTGYVLQYTGNNWSIAFYLAAGAYVLGGLIWTLIDPVTPLEKAAVEQAAIVE
jgi:MFS transporter, ACS family, glucarate transporter